MPMVHHNVHRSIHRKVHRYSCLVSATIQRKAVKGSEKGWDKGSEKSSEKILIMLKAEPELTAKEIAKRLEISPRAVEKQISKLRKEGLLHCIGPAKGGRWEV
jgi:ATP-dependent DNA helicase RecG